MANNHNISDTPPAAHCPTCGAPATPGAMETYRSTPTDGKIDAIEALRNALPTAGEVTAAQHQLLADTANAVERMRIAHKEDLAELLALLIEFGVKAATGELSAEDFQKPIELARKLIRSIP